MSYLLDTDVCIAIIKDHPEVIKRLRSEIHAGSRIFASAIAAFELFYGVAKSALRESNDRSVSTLLSESVTPISFDVADARIAGQIRAKLERAGTPIGMYDLLIAGQALNRDFTLVTANEREFRRVKGLKVANWT